MRADLRKLRDNIRVNATENIISVAPMMDWTDRFDRYFLRRISRHALLYTEMVHAAAVLRGDRDYLLRFDPSEHPVALQLGGCDPASLADAARIGADYGYDAINLNVGCPSDRVQSGQFGACLMADPALVARCVAAMRTAAPQIPVTVKSRIGIDDQDPHKVLPAFLATLVEAGCSHVVIHARKAWLKGLNPKQNREIPPLDYPLVYAMKREFPALNITINGGVETLAEAKEHLRHVDGVMIGRAAYRNPYLLAPVDRDFYDATTPIPDRGDIVAELVPWVDAQCAEGVPLHRITRHILGLFQGQPGARIWRRYLSEHAHLPDAGAATIIAALDRVSQATLAQAA